MNIKVFISDDDKFFAQGLTHILCHYFNEQGIFVDVHRTLDSNVHYCLAFIGVNNLSQYLYARKMIGADTVFAIQPEIELILNRYEGEVKTLQRKQPVSTLLQQIEEVDISPHRWVQIRLPRSLSVREKTVLHYYAIGYTNIKIGELLGIHQKTVSAHKVKAMNKLNFKHKGEFRRWLIETHCP